RPHVAWHAPAQGEPEQRDRERDAQQPRPEPVHVLPEEDRLEVAERHALIQQPVLRDALVLRELGGPRRFVERRNDAGHGLPFGDREPALGEARGPADQHQQRDHHGPEREPAADRAGGVVRRHGISPESMVASLAVSMFPPEITQTTFRAPVSWASAAATDAAPAPSATTRVRSTRSRPASATCRSDAASDPARTCRASGQISSSTLLPPIPSTKLAV